MSDVSGLAGLFTTATGALSLFASENENLARIQTRVQSVMAITMGLQQVFNTLNKDSAFRLVTVVKMKNLLTAANTRLAVALGIFHRCRAGPDGHAYAGAFGRYHGTCRRLGPIFHRAGESGGESPGNGKNRVRRPCTDDQDPFRD